MGMSRNSRERKKEGEGGRDVLDSLCSLLDETQDLVELGGEQVKGCQDPSVRSEVVPRREEKDKTEMSFCIPPERSKTVLTERNELLHDLLIINGISDIDVGVEGHVSDGWVEIDNVGRLLLLMEVRVQTLHKRRLARAGHTYHTAQPRECVQLRLTRAQRKKERGWRIYR
jgi:hypothetical protein